MAGSISETQPHSSASPSLKPTGITASSVLREALIHPYSVIAIVALFSMGIGAVIKHSSEWDEVYLGAANALRHGKNIYHDLAGYTYPPFSAWVMLPFTLVPLRLARGIWYLISSICLIYLIKSSWRLSGGAQVEPLSNPVAARPREQIAFLIGHAIALQLTLNGLTHLQPDIVIAAMLMAGVQAIIGARYFRAATWIGVAAAFKATPLLFAPYLLWRRQWAAAAWLIIVAVGANLLPDTVHRPAEGVWLSNWYHQYLQPMTSRQYMPGDWRNKLDNNQALAGAARRWLTTSWMSEVSPPDANHPLASHIDAKPEFLVVERPNHAGPLVVRAFFAASCLAVLLPAAWIMWRYRRKSNVIVAEDAMADKTLPSQTVIECGMVMMLMVLLSPNSSRAHFCVLYLAAFSAARIAVRPGASMMLRALLAAAILFSTLSIHMRLPGSETGEQILLWIGVVMLATIFLLAASIVTMNAASTFARRTLAPVPIA